MGTELSYRKLQYPDSKPEVCVRNSESCSSEPAIRNRSRLNSNRSRRTYFIDINATGWPTKSCVLGVSSGAKRSYATYTRQCTHIAA